jgi:hypothetical protein
MVTTIVVLLLVFLFANTEISRSAGSIAEISADACQPSVKPSTSYQPHFSVRATLNCRHTTPVGHVVRGGGGVPVLVMLLSRESKLIIFPSLERNVLHRVFAWNMKSTR